MSDSLTVFGTDFTGVTGIKAHATSDSSLMAYIRPSGSTSITQNGTVDVTQYATANVNVAGQDSTFVITVSWDDDYFGQDEGAWVPDCTYAEVQAAAQAEKVITVQVDEDSEVASADGAWNETEAWLGYWTRSFANGIIETSYVFTSTGVQILEGPFFYTEPNLQSKTVSPSTSQQTVTPDQGYNGLSDVTVNAMPTGTAGTPTVTKGSVSNHSVSVTPSVTNTAGYISGGTLTGTAVTVSASELVSGTYTVDSSGTKDVTNYASVSVPTGSATASATKGTVSNHSISVTPSVTRTAGWVTAGTASGTAVNVSASELVSGSETKTANGTYDVTNLASVVVDVQGGTTPVSIGTATYTPESVATSVYFQDLLGEPTSYIIIAHDSLSTGSEPKVAAIVSDGIPIGQRITNTSNAQVEYYDIGISQNPGQDSLYVASTAASFQPIRYDLIYTYGGSAACICTDEVQVGSGATSITFNNLEDEPLAWYLIFKSNFSTSSGYQRVIAVANDGTDTYGLEMDSAAHYSDAHWSSSYSNGSLTISSQGTNAGGYFHQPGYYELVYVIDATGNYQSKTVTPTQSIQQVTADTGYDALKKVTVNAIPNTYVQPTSTVGATTYRASTSNQTIQSGTYHSAAATIAAVTQTNLEAGNIKNGTTVTISNGQSNLWSITGTYTGGGGGSVSYDTKTATASNYPVSLEFTSMKGEPKAFVLRLNAQVSSSGNTTYYYIVDIAAFGTTTHGNCFRVGGTRRVDNITSGYSWSYSGTTLTVTSSASSRSASPGAFYSGSYELLYAY